MEATLSLTIFLLFMMFMTNFGQIYMAQEYVTHGLLQTGKMLSFSSYQYSQISAVNFLNQVMDILNTGSINEAQGIEASWRTGNYSSAVQKAFPYCAGGTAENNRESLKRYGISSIAFDAEVEGSDLTITATYKIDLVFAFFGYEQVTMRQQVKNGLWK